MTAMLRLQEFRLCEEIETSLQWSHDRTFSGFAFDAADPARTFVVELLVDGHPVRCMHAVDYVASLATRGVGDGCHGFAFSFAEGALQGDEVVEARIANLGTPVGKPIALREAACIAGDAPPGAVRWLGGLHFSGWIAESGDPVVDIFVDDEKVDRARANGWSHIGGAEDPRAVRAFECSLPARFADGATRHFAAVNSKGEHLEGSPQPFFAPFQAGEPEPTANGARLKAAVIIVGAGDVDTTSQSLDAQGHPEWVAASLPEAGEFAGFDNEAARSFFDGEGAGAEFAVFLLSGVRLDATALTRIAEAFANHRRAVVVLGDAAVGDVENDGAHGFALRRSAAERVLRTGANSLRQVFASIRDDRSLPAQAVVRLPGPIAGIAVD
jgi:hypothetical protein